MIEDSIIFIGPIGVGKTSVAERVSEILGINYVHIDDLRWQYFDRQKDYDSTVVENYFKQGNEIEAFQYMKPFEARLVVDFLQEMSNVIFDFGAGYSVYNDEFLFEKVKSAFSKYKYVIFLRYSNDVEESLKILHGRHNDIPDNLYFYLNKNFIESACNELLSTHIVDTKNKPIEQVVDSVLEIIKT